MVQSTRSTQPQRTKFDQIEWGEAAMQESAYGTALGTANINHNFPRNSDIVFVDRAQELVGEDEVGYGDEWPRNDYINKQGLRIDGISYRLTSEMAMLFAALGLGKVDTVDNLDNSLEHTFVPQDPTLAKQAGRGGFSQSPHTSFRYKAGPNQFIAHSAVLESFEISGAPESFPNIVATIVGSGEETVDANAFAAVGTPHNLRLVNVQVGVADSEESIVDAVREVTFGWNNTPSADEGHVPGSLEFMGQLLFGQRVYSLGINFDQHSTDVERAAQLAQTAQKAILTYEGDIIAGVNKHHMIVTAHRVRIATRGESDANNRRRNDIEYSPRADGSGDFLTIAVQNEITDTVLDVEP